MRFSDAKTFGLHKCAGHWKLHVTEKKNLGNETQARTLITATSKSYPRVQKRGLYNSWILKFKLTLWDVTFTCWSSYRSGLQTKFVNLFGIFKLQHNSIHVPARSNKIKTPGGHCDLTGCHLVSERNDGSRKITGRTMAEEVKGKEQEWNSKRESRKVSANQEKWVRESEWSPFRWGDSDDDRGPNIKHWGKILKFRSILTHLGWNRRLAGLQRGLIWTCQQIRGEISF